MTEWLKTDTGRLFVNSITLVPVILFSRIQNRISEEACITQEPPFTLLLTFLFLTSSPCRWLIWRKEPLELMVLTGLTARTGLLDDPERPLTSPAVPFPNRAPLLTLQLLMDKDLYRLLSNEDFPAVCRSVWDLTLSDISKPDQRCFV